MVEQLAPAEVHVVVTAREPLGLFAASWQESLKNRDTTPMADYGRAESDDPRRRLELAHAGPAPGAPALGAGRSRAEHVHVLPLPGSDAPRGRSGTASPGCSGSTPTPRPQRRVPQRVHGRGRGRDPAPDQRAPRRVHQGDRQGHLHPHLPRRRAPGAARGRALWPAERPDRRLPAPRPRGGGLRARAGVRRGRRPGHPAGARRPARAPPPGLGHRRRRSPRWRSSWWPRCSATYATCGTSDAAARRARRSSAKEDPACASLCRAGSRCWPVLLRAELRHRAQSSEKGHAGRPSRPGERPLA